MVRIATLLLAAVLVWGSTAAWSLGLGSLTSRSALNQPFVGEIALFDVDPSELDTIKVRLASAADFDKAGVQRPHFLTLLRFEPKLDASGRPIVQVSSREPMREPYLDFLVEVVWPRGRLVKQYTILLDPPQAGVAPAPVVSEGQLLVSETNTPATAAAPTVPAASAVASSDVYPIRYGPVKAGTGLWSIAKTMSREGATVAQTAMAIYRSNPQAFRGGNINNLVPGTELIIPSAAELFALTPAEAEVEFKNAQAGKPVRNAPLAVAAAPTESQEHTEPLKKKPEPEELAPAAPGAAVVPAAEAVSESSSADSLPATGLAAASAVAPPAPSSAAAPAVEPTPEPAADQAPVVTAVPSAAAPAPSEPVATAADPAAEALRRRIEELEAQLQRHASPQTSPEASSVPSGWPWWIFAALGGGAAALIALVALIMRRARALPPAQPESTPTAAPLADSGAPPAASAPQPFEDITLTVDARTLQPPVTPPPRTTPPAEDAPAPPPDRAPRPVGLEHAVAALTPEQQKTVRQADLFIAYGRYREAQTVLQQLSREAPQSPAVRYKLAEAYAGAGNLAALRALLEQMVLAGDDRAAPEQWQRLRDLLAQSDAAARAITAPAPAEVPEKRPLEQPEERFDLDLGELPLPQPRASAAPSISSRRPVAPDDAADITQTLHATSADTTALEPKWDIPASPPAKPSPAPAAESPTRAAKLDFVDLTAAASTPDLDVSLPVEDWDKSVAARGLGDPLADLAALDESSSMQRAAPSGAMAKAEPPDLGERTLELDLAADLEKLLGNDHQPPGAESSMTGSGRFSGLSNLDAESAEQRAESTPAPARDTFSPTGLFSGESLLNSDSGASDVLSSQWRIDSGVWDEVTTKMDLAFAYLEMKDTEAARGILEEVLREGNEEQRAEAQALLAKIG